LCAAGADPATPVVGTDDRSQFTRTILNDEDPLDIASGEKDILATRDALVTNYGGIGAVLLECANMLLCARHYPRGCG
jgi:hypothetical protein